MSYKRTVHTCSKCGGRHVDNSKASRLCKGKPARRKCELCGEKKARFPSWQPRYCDECAPASMKDGRVSGIVSGSKIFRGK